MNLILQNATTSNDRLHILVNRLEKSTWRFLILVTDTVLLNLYL